MKKLICIFLTLSLIILPFSSCSKNKDKNLIRLSEVTHSVFYAPFYVAIENGFFEEENLKIELSNGGGADNCMTAILSGGVDMALLGPEASIYVVLEGRKDKPVVFSQLTKRDGSFLMGRENKGQFSWKDVENKEIIAGRKGGVPAMTLEYVLNKNGLFDGENVTLNYDVQFSLTAPAFIGGTGDFVTMFEPTATECQNEGNGYILTSIGKESGEIPYTAFTTLQSYIDDNENTIERFLRAMQRAIFFVEDNNAETIANVIKKQFPSTEISSLISSINSYKEIDAWVSNTAMTEESFSLLQTVMQSAGELPQKANFGDVVNTEYANKIYNEINGTRDKNG